MILYVRPLRRSMMLWMMLPPAKQSTRKSAEMFRMASTPNKSVTSYLSRNAPLFNRLSKNIPLRFNATNLAERSVQLAVPSRR